MTSHMQSRKAAGRTVRRPYLSEAAATGLVSKFGHKPVETHEAHKRTTSAKARRTTVRPGVPFSVLEHLGGTGDSA